MVEVFLTALKLGLTSFGGPVAHLGYFHREYVVRKRWLDEAAYADLVALCQALPGPASSQVGMAIGFTRAGAAGAVAAWLGFTLPSALVMGVSAFLWTGTRGSSGVLPGLVRGLSLVALAVVFQAVWVMGRKLLTGRRHAVLAAGAVLVLALVPSPFTPLLVLLTAAVLGIWLFRVPGEPEPVKAAAKPSTVGVVCLVLFFGLMVLLPWARVFAGTGLVSLADGFYRTGALVFGGGHVVLPLLQNELVAPGRVGAEAFLAGYGLVQAVPGPLFTLAAYLGYLTDGVPGALVALVAVFLPSFFLVLGVLPYWDRLKANPWFRRSLAGVNAAVVGLLAWALYNPVFLGAVHTPVDLAVGLALGVWLMAGKAPPWAVVLVGAAAGLGLGML